MGAASKALTASGAVKDRPGMLAAVLLTAGEDAASVTIYDNTAGSGTKLAVLKAGSGATVSFTPAVPVVAGVGLYATISGTTPDVVVVYA